MNRLFLLSFCFFIFSCSEEHECNSCFNTANLNGESWSSNGINRMVLDNNDFILISFYSANDQGYFREAIDFTISSSNFKVNNFQCANDIPFNHEESNLIKTFYGTFISDGDVTGSSYKLDPNYNSFFTIQSIDGNVVSGSYDCKYIIDSLVNPPYPGDPLEVHFSDGQYKTILED